jgi:hypothetical protein
LRQVKAFPTSVHNTLCVLLDVQLALHQTGALPTMVQ